MRGRPGKRPGAKKAKTKIAKKSTRAKTVRAKTGRAATKKAKAPARKKVARKTVAAPARKKTTARKAAARKTTAKRTTKRTPRVARKEVFGEGNYTAAREFRDQETNFVRRNRKKIESLGEEAKAALEGDEGEELERAEEEARSHSHSPDEEV